jgi:hypothetical protein
MSYAVVSKNREEEAFYSQKQTLIFQALLKWWEVNIFSHGCHCAFEQLRNSCACGLEDLDHFSSKVEETVGVKCE